MLRMTLLGLRRKNNYCVKRARPITPNILRKMYHCLNMNNPVDAVFWCTSLFAFFLLFRKSNLLPDKQDGFDPQKQLRHQDCVMVNGRIIVGIRWAKNEQFKRELLTFPLPRLQNSILCPFTALNNVRRLIPYTPTDHIFKLNNTTSLTYRAFQVKLRDTLKLANVEYPNSYSSHSYRRGGTTFCFLCGIPLQVIRLLGNWRSDAFLAYIEFPLETRTAATELMKQRILACEKAQSTLNELK